MKVGYKLGVIFVSIAVIVVLTINTAPTMSSIASPAVAGAWGRGQAVLFDRTTDPLNTPRFIIYDGPTRQVASTSPHVLDSMNIPNWPDWYKFDAAIRIGDTAYLFRNSNYLAYDLVSSSVIIGPRAITLGWNGWPNGWNSVDEAIYIDNTRTYFFRGSQLIEYNTGNSQVTRQPTAISSVFGSWPPQWDHIDAAIRSSTDGDKIFFFRNEEFLRYSLSANKVDQAPQPVNNATWPGWVTSWLQHGVAPDAALPWAGGQYMFFKGEFSLSFNPATNTTPGSTQPVANIMPNLPWGWRNVDATLNFGNNKVYAFNGGYVIGLDQANGSLEAPREIGAVFPGLAGWEKIDAAFYAGNNIAYFFNGSDAIRYNVQTRSAEAGYPKPISNTFDAWIPSWTSVNMAVHFGDGAVYFHRGGEVLLVNLVTNRVEAMPQPNNPAWTGGFLAFPWISTDLRGGAVFGTGPFGKLVQKLNFGAFQPKLLTDLPFQVYAITSSGLQATILSVTPDVCRINNGNWVVFGNSIDKGPGICTLKASLAGNDWFDPIEELESFEILPLGATAPPTWTPTPTRAGVGSLTATPILSVPGTVTSTIPSSGGKLNQTINFGLLPDRILIESPIQISAMASSGLPVTFSSLSADICSVSGNTVSLIKAGTCIIKASQLGNELYNPAADVGRAFNIFSSGTPIPTFTPTPTSTPIPTPTPTAVPNPSSVFLPALWRDVGPVMMQ
jgi:hypothetical protein